MIEVLDRNGPQARRLAWRPVVVREGRRHVALFSDAGRLACPSKLARLLTPGSQEGPLVVRFRPVEEVRARRPPLPWVVLAAVRWETLPASLLPVAAGLLVSGCPALLATLILGSVLALHAAANLAGEAFDHVSGNDAIHRLGGSKVVQQGFVSARTLGLAAAVLALAGAALGLAVVAGVAHPVPVLAMGAAGLLLAWQFSAPPLRLGRYLIGAMLLLSLLGPGLAGAAAYAAAGTLPARALWIGLLAMLPLALERHLVSLRRLPDDSLLGRRTIALALGYRGSLFALMALALLLVLAPPVVALVGSPRRALLFAMPLLAPSLLLALLPVFRGYGPHDPSLGRARRSLRPALLAWRAILLASIGLAGG